MIKLSGVTPISEVTKTKQGQLNFKFKSIYDDTIITSLGGKNRLSIKRYLRTVDKTVLQYFLDLNQLTEDDVPLCLICKLRKVKLRVDLLKPKLLDYCSNKKCSSHQARSKQVATMKRRVDEDGVSDYYKYIEKNSQSRIGNPKVIDGRNRATITKRKLVESTGKLNARQKQVLTMKSLVDNDGVSEFDKLQKKVAETKHRIANNEDPDYFKKINEKSINTMINNGTYDEFLENLIKVGGRVRRSRVRRYKDSKLKYGSSYEKSWLDRLDDISIIENGFSIRYDLNDRIKTYISDFFIPCSNTVVEIKSTPVMIYLQSVIEVYHKLKACIENGYNVLFVLDHKEHSFTNLHELDKFFNKYDSA